MGTSTKCPLIKYTPSATPTAYPVDAALIEDTVRIVSPITKVVLPYVTFSSKRKTSPSKNSTVDESLAASLYFTNKVTSSTSSSGGRRYPFILPTASEVSPITCAPFPPSAATSASR